jgi:hypothetical protein
MYSKKAKMVHLHSSKEFNNFMKLGGQKTGIKKCKQRKLGSLRKKPRLLWNAKIC